MKLNKAYLLIAAFVAVSFVGCKDEDPSVTSFDNKVYIDAVSKTTKMLIKPSNAEATQSITAAIAKPAEQQIDLAYKVDLSKVETYNKAYYAEAIVLPAENYEFADNKAVIPAGGVKSTAVSIHFKDINKLDRELLYVLPVTLVSASNIEMLESARTVYYLFEGAALINTVGDIAQNYLRVDWKNSAVLSGMKTITVESLIRVRDFGTVGGKKGEAMSTILGIEGQFLIRLGDSGFPSNQVQLVSPSGNFPGGNATFGLPTNKWVHVAVVYDTQSGSRIIYIDGKVQAQDANARGSVTLSSTNFYIGFAWNDQRWLEGEISEVRIWNIVRTQEQIAANPYEVDPASEGLVTYWKFDEGAGAVVKDHTANGNDATAHTEIKWTTVSLPESSK
ncbi:MAG: DUF1735 and LamG domain-containing protein [Alistipes sp.]